MAAAVSVRLTTTTSSAVRAQLVAFASAFNLPIIEECDNSKNVPNLCRTEYFLEANARQHISLAHRSAQGQLLLSVACDFSSPQWMYRYAHGQWHNSPLIRAMHLSNKSSRETHVLDGTAGLGKDTFILASQGYRVTAYERHSIIYALLYDGWRRALATQGVCDIAERISITHADHHSWHDPSASLSPDIVYLDPMFPLDEHPKAELPLPKKEMQITRTLVGSSSRDDINELLVASMTVAAVKVVFKRPSYANIVHVSTDEGIISPIGKIEGEKHRFDIYRR